MLEQSYRDLRKQLAREDMFRIRDSYGAATVLAEVAVFGASLALLMAVHPYSLLYWLVQIFLGFSMFRMFVILHECGHKSLFTSRAVCTVVGSVASAVCLVPYVPWRNIHKQHHKWVGVIDKDPTQRDLLELQRANKARDLAARIVWKLWLPFMFVTLIGRTFWGYPVRELRAGNRKDGVPGALSWLVSLAGPVCAVAFLGWKGALVTFGPAFVVYAVIFENMSLPQHAGLFPFLSKTHPNPIPSWEQDEVTRTTNTPNWRSLLLSYNFNLHTEHHLFPAAPWYSLPTISRRVAEIESYRAVNFVSYMVEARTSDPMVLLRDPLPKVPE